MESHALAASRAPNTTSDRSSESTTWCVDDHLSVAKQASARKCCNLSGQVVDELLAFGLTQRPHRALTFPLYRETRKSLAADIAFGNLPAALQAELEKSFSAMNDSYQFSLSGDPPQINLLRYAVTDYFDWHMDVGGPEHYCRKLTFSIQLSDPDSYVGGDLEVFNGETFVAGRERGGVCVFPPFLPHRVTPVTRGTRFALVGWFCGPAFR